MKKITLLIAFSLIAFFSAFAQPQMDMKPNTGIIAGKLEDNQQIALQYVNVLLHNQSDSLVVDAVATDDQGMFFFKDINYGTYFIEFKFLGFKNKYINNIAISESNKFVKIGKVSLDTDDKELGAVVIQGQASNVSYQIDKKVINVDKDILASGGDASDALRNVPSVNVDVNGDVTIRGSSNFTVMINGKPSIMDPNDALKSIPAENIDRIELITNPSAKYDPDGDAGIINIITKNKKDDGFSGKIEIGGDNNLGYKGDILLNYKKNKINLFTEFNINNRTRPMQYNSYRESYLPTDTFYMQSTGKNIWGHGGMEGKIGLNYYITDKTTLTLTGSLGTHGFNSSSSSNQHIWYSDNYQPENYFVNTAANKMMGYTKEGEIDIEHKFDDKGQNIKAYLEYSYFNPTSINSTSMDTTNSNWAILNNDPFQQRTTQKTNRSSARFQVDYVLPLKGKSKFETGYSFRSEVAGGDYKIENLNSTNNWIEIDSVYNNMTMYRKIHAGYATYSSSLGKLFDFELGLRVEYTDRLITETVTNANYPITRFDYFPTLHLSKSLPFDQQIQFSYSKRINRPRGWNLNPFPMYIDQYTIRKGNPALLPEYAHSFELNYLKTAGKNSISLETFYRITEGKIDRIEQTQGAAIVYTSANLNKDYSLGGELSANLVVFKMLMINLSTSAFDYRITGTLDGNAVDTSTFTWNSRINFMTMLPTGTGIQFGGFYNAPSITLQGTQKGMFVSFLGIRQSFLKNKFSISVQVQDLFNTMRFSSINNTKYLYSETEFSSLHPTIGFTLTYRLNNFKQDKNKDNGGNDNGSSDYMGEGQY